MKKSLLALLAVLGFAGAHAGNGTVDSPYTVDDLLDAGLPASAVADVYVTGYIVGWVNTGNTWGTDNVYAVPAAVATNIILSSSSSEKEADYCIPVQLPSGAVRNALNLVDNPENLGHQVTLKGSWEKYFGTNGFKSVSEYKWVGDAPVHENVTYGPEVTGTAENPLDVAGLIAATAHGTSIPNTYLKAVIVGYVPGMKIEEAVFGAGADASATNIIVAADASCKNPDECVAVQLPSGAVRDALNLAANPGNLGKTVTLLGTNTKYFGTYGLKEVSAYAFGDEEIEAPAAAFYAGLEKNADDWTFDNVSLSGALTYVWSWKSDYNYLNASAYVGGANAAEAYAVSPVLDLAGKTSANVTFDHAAKFQTNLRTDCKLCVREAGASSWTELTIPTWPEAGAWTFVNAGEISLNDYVGKKIELAFKYVSTATSCDTWEIKNFFVNAEGADSAVETVAFDAPVYGGYGCVLAPEGAQVYNINGVKVGTENLAKGLYIVVLNKKAVKVVVK